ncbi:Equilibrative Nucleoside Transporter (ENT) Family [Thraustotheca clavata]|uniref:Equilibrative Nucleoside Transporter (ENT) Family n=1 Tax=Thraustotheca clavata TaxID=74557 RepID=A0A1V9ZJR3_9STRA|nr:Equilibrative Nucleoside Transporter (ENT) Family [Thraustotheca clavata]
MNDLEVNKTVLYRQVIESNEMPTIVLDDIEHNRRFIWWALLFLNGSCLWAYYSCLSAQTYYAARFSNTTLRFEYLTTPISTWPMFFGHFIQVLFGLDKKLGLLYRVRIGYLLYILSAIAILLQDICDFTPFTGAIIVLVSFGVIGFTNSLTEATFYALSALFPEAQFSDAIQLGNGTSGILNITLNTLTQLIVGGHDPQFHAFERIQKLSFYIFFGIFIAFCLVAIFVYQYLIQTPSIRYLIECNEAETTRRNHESFCQKLKKLASITWTMRLPLISQCLIFVCSLTSFPGIGISSGYQLAAKQNATWGNWYVNGVLLSYNYGDFAGRYLAPNLYPWFTLTSCFLWSILRWGLLVLLLLGLPGNDANPLFCMENAYTFNLVWQLIVNALLGLTTGILSTITIGLGPRLLPQEDRESASAIMCLGLFLGICVGATIGLEIGQNHWFGA